MKLWCGCVSEPLRPHALRLRLKSPWWIIATTRRRRDLAESLARALNSRSLTT
jgi:hypothetical protein